MTSEPYNPEAPRIAMHVVTPVDAEDEALGAVASSLEGVASTMDDLTSQLTALTEAYGRTKMLRTTEAEIGRLFVRAQGYVDDSIADARERARQIVAGAQEQAFHIIDQAHAQAAEIVEQARRQAVLRPEAVARLSTTIEGFSRMNVELVNELSMLRETLSPMPGLTEPARPEPARPDPASVSLPGGQVPIHPSPGGPTGNAQEGRLAG